MENMMQLIEEPIKKTDVEVLKDYLFDNGVKTTWLSIQLGEDKAWVTRLFHTPELPLDVELKARIEKILKRTIFTPTFTEPVEAKEEIRKRYRELYTILDRIEADLVKAQEIQSTLFKNAI